MKYADLIDYVAENANIAKSSAKEAVEAMIDGIFSSLKSNEDIAIPKLGTFTVRERAAREGRNPQTGEKLTIDARKVPGFKPAKALKDEVKDL